MNSTDRDRAREFIEWLDFCGYVDDEWIVEQAQLSQHSKPQRAKQEIREAMATRIATALAEVRRETWEAAIRTAQLSVKKSINAKLDVAAAEILIRRLEAAKEKACTN